MAPSDQLCSPMSFTESQHGNIMLEKLRCQKEEGRFCDVTLYVGGKQFRAHRSVLASCSPYFDSILKMHRVVKERLTVTCQNSEVFQCLLNYMYTGNVSIDKDNVSEMLRLANHFLVSKLKNYCAEYLDRYLDMGNCLAVKDLAEKYNMSTLLKHATLYVQLHIFELIQQEEVLGYSVAQVQDFITDKTLQFSDETMLAVCCSWVSHDRLSREAHLPTLLSHVDWSTLGGPGVISAHLEEQALYTESSACLLAALQSLEDCGLLGLMPIYQQTFHALKEKDPDLSEEYPPASLQNVPDASEEKSPEMDFNGNQGEVQLGAECNATNFEGSNELAKEEVLEEEVPKQERRQLTHLWRTPVARLSALRRLQGRQMAAAIMSNRKRALLLEGEGEEDSLEEEPEEEGEEPTSAEVSKGGLRCHVCDHEAEDVNELEQHAASQHAEEVEYKCGLCNFTCRWNKEYYAHMRQHFSGPPFKCDSCEYTCDRIHLVLTHRMIHTDTRPFVCEQCGYRCRTKPNLAVHQRCHSGERPFKCKECSRTFAMKSTLEQHLATHNSDRPYLCDICGFSTKYLSHLIAHKRIHTGEVYRCSYPHCKYSTPKKSQLGSHMRTHMGVRPHTCTICGRGFLEKSHLVRHERIHLEDKPFKCAQCDYASSRRDKLKEHFSRHHGENASAKVPYRPRPPRRTKYDTDMELIMSGVQLPPPPPPPPHQSTQNHLAYPPSAFEPQHMPEFSMSKPEDLQHLQTHAASHRQMTSVAAAATAAMMLDPRFHGNHHVPQPYAEHQAPPPQRSIPMGMQTTNQHVPSADYSTLQTCMPLF